MINWGDMTKVFISYARKDIRRVKRIANNINSLGFDSWMDERKLQGGDIWTKEIVEAISSCDLFLLFMSSSSMASDSVRREVQLAFDKKKKIVILRLEEIGIPRKLQFQLAGIQWIETSKRKWKSQLITAINTEALSRPSGHPRPLPKASGQIRVLIVDEDAMVRKAWRKVLNDSRQIRVIGEANPFELGKFTNAPEPPEILVAGHSFMEAGYLKGGIQQSFWESRPKVIMIVENREQIKTAFKNGADFAAAKPFDSQDLITWVRALSDDAKRLCSEYHNRFSKIRAIQSQNKKYSELVGSILQLLFHPDLVNPESARMLADVPLSSRLILRNQAREHKFWIDAHEMHRSKYLTFDIYNEPVGADKLKALGKYLSESHGLMGFVIGRNLSMHDLQVVSIAFFENEGKVVLPLDDSQLQAMLEYKAGGVNPAFELENLYQKLIADAGN